MTKFWLILRNLTAGAKYLQKICNRKPCLCPKGRADLGGFGLAAFPPRPLELLCVHQQLTEPSIWALKKAKRASILVNKLRRSEIPPELWNSYPRLGARKGVAKSPGGHGLFSTF